VVWAATYRDYIWVEHGVFGVLVVGLAGALVASICVALAGVGFRALRGARDNKLEKEETAAALAPAQPSGALTEPTKPDTRARRATSTPPATTLISPDRFYSRAEKERIVDAMNLIQQGFANVGRKMMWEAEKNFF
jgi:hypothetical protein